MARRLSGTVQAGLERIHLSRGRDSSPGRQRHGSGDGAESLQASGNKRLVSVGWPKGSVKGDEARLAIGVVSYDQPRHFLLHAQDGTPLTVDLELNGKVVASGALSGVPAVRAVPAAAQAPCTRPPPAPVGVPSPTLSPARPGRSRGAAPPHPSPLLTTALLTMAAVLRGRRAAHQGAAAAAGGRRRALRRCGAPRGPLARGTHHRVPRAPRRLAREGTARGSRAGLI